MNLPKDILNMICDFAYVEPEYKYKKERIVDINFYCKCKHCHQPVKPYLIEVKYWGRYYSFFNNNEENDKHNKCKMIEKCTNMNLKLHGEIKEINSLLRGTLNNNNNIIHSDSYIAMIKTFYVQRERIIRKIQTNIKKVNSMKK